MKTLHHIALFRFALLAPVSFAQAPVNTTGLPAGIEATGDTAEVRALTEWAEEYHHTQPKQARQIADRVLTLARELDDQRGIGESLMMLGRLSSDLSQKEVYFTAAREAFEQAGNERGLTRNRLSLGMVYANRGELNKALTAYFNALRKFEHLGDVEGQARALNVIGITYQTQGNSEEARAYLERAVALAETLEDPPLLTRILGNLGGVLSEQEAYENSEDHLRRALTISEESNNRSYMAATSNNLGYVLNMQGRHQEALSFLLTAEQLSKELEANVLLGAVYDELGKAYLGLSRYDRALHYASESLTLARETRSVSFQMDAHQTLSQIYEASGNSDQALRHHQQYAAARDSVYNAEKAEIITEMQTRYETEEKQRAIEHLEQENRIQALQTSRWRIGMIAGMGGLFLLLGFLYNRYRLKQRANRLLEELDAAKSRFFANISHEFRTPLTVILGAAQDALAGRFDGKEEEFVEQQHAVFRNARQLHRLVDEVLDLNRLESGKLELQLAPGDLVRSLRQIVEADAPLAERNGVDLAFESDVENCPRLYDEEKLEKIVGNLLSNALKFTSKGGTVRVSLDSSKNTTITVADDGPGIPAEMQANVFERFVQVKPAPAKAGGSHHGGTGIGLALAKELTELHDGTIRLESEPGNGSTFTVRLPLEETTLDDVQRTAPQKRGGGIPASKEELEVGGDGESPSPIGRGGRGEGLDRTTVLVIEDNNDVRAFVRRSLEETYRVLETADGETGLQQARAELPDLIVSDVMLPGIDGYEIARRLKAEPDTECIPVVMLTARAAEEDQTEGYGSGAEVYITKPFVPETLRAAVARLLEERRRLRRRLREEAKQAIGDDSKNSYVTLRERARSVIRETLYDETFGVEELASSLNLTRQTLYNRFKSEIGHSPSDFIRTLRLERAHELLSDGAGTVSEVAYAVGFNSRVAFSRAYSAHYGAPPSAHLGREKNASG